MPDSGPSTGIYLVDTSELFGALIGDVGERKKMDAMCHLLGMTTEHRHNAGNDAHVSFITVDETSMIN